MSEITKPIMLDETGQDIAASLATIATQNRDIYSAATQAAASATAAQGSASNAEDEATAAAASAAEASQKLDDLKTFLGELDPESAASVAAELGLFEREVASDYAKKDGYYEQMGVGTADNLSGHGSVNAEYTFRTSGGDSDIGTGAAAIDTVKGNTLVWNQLVDANTTSVDTVSGHKYLTNISGVKSIITSNGTSLSVTGGTDCVYDLTKMFGAGYEPSTVAEFEARYPLKYYAYNAGTLINSSASGIKTIGFNQWDEQWELGQYDTNTGAPVPSTTQIRSKSNTPIRVVPNTAYCFTIGSQRISQILWYDANDNFISKVSNSSDRVFVTTSPENAYYLRFQCPTAYGKVYNNDICINLSWSGYRNGEYEPYQENTVYFDSVLGASGSLATIKGKLLVDGQPTGESVEVFHDGMKSVLPQPYNSTSAIDEAKGQTAVVRIYGVNLSQLEYSIYTGVSTPSKWFYAQLPKSAVNLGSSAYHPFMCPNYSVATTTDARYGGTGADKTVNVVSTGLFIRDDSCADADAFKSANNNVWLYYILATPETYLLDNPLPVNYVVNDFGTEQRLPADTSSSVMAPILYSVQYAMNATDTIRRLPVNYISKDSFENFCASLASAIGPYLNPPATIVVTPTYNDNTQEYDYQVTVTPTENNG